MKRYLCNIIDKDLTNKMVFLGGPRQVGKTTIAKQFLTSADGYLNWDIDSHRASILKKELPQTNEWIFDELHRYRGWRDFLKGIFDEFGTSKRILVTGSARLDFYKYAGDTLQGRYNFIRLHPLSVRELNLNSKEELSKLLQLGGFPEPYFSNDPREARRWSQSYRSRLIQEEIIKIEQIKDLSKLELLMLRLPELVAAPLSINGLREDLNCSHDTVTAWLDMLERFYAIFRISPFGSPMLKAVKKQQKHYHYDWTLVENPGSRFENFIASHLLKWVDYQLDVEGYRYELRYYKDQEDREVDFVLCKNGIPIHLIECKTSYETTHKGLSYLKKKLPDVKATIVCLDSEKNTVNSSGIESTPALEFLQQFV